MIREGETTQEKTKERGLFSNNNKPNKLCKLFNKPHKMGYNYGQAQHDGYQAQHDGYEAQHGYSQHAYGYHAQPPVSYPGFGYSQSASGFSNSGAAHAYPPIGPKPQVQNYQQEEYYHHEESIDMYESNERHGNGHGGYNLCSHVKIQAI